MTNATYTIGQAATTTTAIANEEFLQSLVAEGLISLGQELPSYILAISSDGQRITIGEIGEDGRGCNGVNVSPEEVVLL